MSIFLLASSGSYNLKNDNIHRFFAVLVANFEFADFASKQKMHRLDSFHGNGPYCKILTKKESIRLQGFT